jgi:hypothetical protein
MGKTVGLVFEAAGKGESNHFCPVCGKEYKTREGLENHIRDKHPEVESPGE